MLSNIGTCDWSTRDCSLDRVGKLRTTNELSCDQHKNLIAICIDDSVKLSRFRNPTGTKFGRSKLA